MAIIEINQQSYKFGANDFLNIKSLLPRLQKEYSLKNTDVKKISINGIEIDINSEDPCLVRPIQESDLIQINFTRSSKHLYEMLKEILTLIDATQEKITAATNIEVNEANNGEFDKCFEKILDAVSIFSQSMQFLINNIDKKEELYAHLPIKDLRIHLLSVVKGADGAHKQQDYIMLSDLLEYELRDNLTKWKILVIPTIKKRLSGVSMSI